MLPNEHPVLVTGATSGIGLATTRHLHANNAGVVALGRDFSRLDEACPDDGTGRLQRLRFDLTDMESYRGMVGTLPVLRGVVLSHGIVINNPVKFFSLEKYRKIIEINQTAPLLLVSELYRANKLAEGTSVVFVSSIAGTTIGIKGCAAYAASKAALVGIARVLALEFGHKGIRVNCISPGMVNTPLVDGVSQLSEDARTIEMKRYPLGERFAAPDEVAKSIAYLLSDASSFVTGQNLVIDGGRSVY